MQLERIGIAVCLGLGGCNVDAFGLGGSGSAGVGSETATHGSEGMTSTGSSATVGTEPGSGGLDSGSTTSDPGASSSGASGSTTAPDPSDTTGSGSTGDTPAPWCPARADLAACYDFAGVGGGTLLDLSGNGNDADAIGVGVIAGPLGEAATFDGGSQIAVPDSASLDIAGPITVEAWILVDALPPSGRVGVVDNELQYGMTIHFDDQYRCAMAGATLFVGPVVLGQWSHLACVFDGASLRIYVNGAELGSVDAAGPLSTDNGDPMSIGDTSPAFDEPLPGAIGGLRVWSTARTAEQLCEAAGEAADQACP